MSDLTKEDFESAQSLVTWRACMLIKNDGMSRSAATIKAASDVSTLFDLEPHEFSSMLARARRLYSANPIVSQKKCHKPKTKTRSIANVSSPNIPASLEPMAIKIDENTTIFIIVARARK